MGIDPNMDQGELMLLMLDLADKIEAEDEAEERAEEDDAS
ncbi:MAG: hypothetical protein RL701_3529 [Pseudomonadota bacterium]|jgi:hypothetical protein